MGHREEINILLVLLDFSNNNDIKFKDALQSLNNINYNYKLLFKMSIIIDNKNNKASTLDSDSSNIT